MSPLKLIKQRIIEISYNKKLSHLGSCLTACDIIYEIFKTKQPDDRFILSSGHAGLALYCVLEAFGGRNAEEVYDHHGVHPDRCSECELFTSSGSLGHGLGIGIGAALANPQINVYVLISDGETSEGSIWESLRVRKELNLTNLILHFNINGYAAYQEVDKEWLKNRLWDYEHLRYPFFIHETTVNQLPFLKDQDAHYYTMKEEDYQLAMETYAD